MYNETKKVNVYQVCYFFKLVDEAGGRRHSDIVEDVVLRCHLLVTLRSACCSFCSCLRDDGILLYLLLCEILSFC